MDANQALILAIETSQRAGSVAVGTLDGDDVQVESLRSTARHEDDLLPAIDRLIRTRDASPHEVRAVAVSIGPGGFTGLRIAITTAKMLAEVTGCELIGIPSALVVADGATHSGRLHIALATKRDAWWATEVDSGDPPAIIGTPRLVSVGDDAPDPDFDGVDVIVADEHWSERARQQCEKLGLPIISPTFDAAACLHVGRRWRVAQQTVDPLSLSPIYPREPEAVRLWKNKT